MNAWAIALTAALAAPLLAAAPVQPVTRCPQGITDKPSFSGHPFHPIHCPGSPLPRPADAASAGGPALPQPTPDHALLSLADLAGRWEGILPIGIQRYDLFWEFEKKGWGDSWSIRFESMEYKLLNRQAFHARFRNKGKGRYRGTVSCDSLRGSLANATLSLGVPPAAPPGAEAWEREFLLSYDALPGEYRIRFSRSGKDRIHFLFWDPLNPGEPFAGELVRSQRESL